MEFLSNIDPLKVAMLSFAITGFVKLVDSLFDGDYRAASKIAVSAVAGSFLSQFIGLDWFTGLVIGFSASGVITTLSYLGSRSAVQVDKANVVNSETVAVASKSKKNA